MWQWSLAFGSAACGGALLVPASSWRRVWLKGSHFFQCAYPSLRSLWRYAWVIYLGLGLSYASTSLTGEYLYWHAFRRAPTVPEVFHDLHLAAQVFPLDYALRRGPAHAAMRYGRLLDPNFGSAQMITSLRTDPWSADMWGALAIFRDLAGDSAGAARAREAQISLTCHLCVHKGP